MLKHILLTLALFCSHALSQNLLVVFDANLTEKNDSIHSKHFLSIAKNLLSSLERDKVTITDERINSGSLSIKERYNLLDSLSSDLYISLSNDVENDSNLYNITITKNRIEKLGATKSKKSKLDSLFHSEYLKLSGKSVLSDAEIFYPITIIHRPIRRTHMVLDLKPVLDTFLDTEENEKLINHVVKVLHTCIMQYVDYL